MRWEVVAARLGGHREAVATCRAGHAATARTSADDDSYPVEIHDLGKRIADTVLVPYDA
jgi:hypothetical protein